MKLSDDELTVMVADVHRGINDGGFVFMELRGRFGYAIRRFLSKGDMSWDDAGGEGDLLLWGLIRSFDPQKNDNVAAYVASVWRFEALRVLDAQPPRTIELDETFHIQTSNAFGSAEDTYFEAVGVQGTTSNLADLTLNVNGVSSVDIEAALAFVSVTSWRPTTGKRTRISPGFHAASVYAAAGIIFTPAEAAGKARKTINTLKKELSHEAA